MDSPTLTTMARSPSSTCTKATPPPPILAEPTTRNSGAGVGSLLVRDDDGGIVGVVARIDGRRVPLRARRGVFLTTGGFINDDEMLSRHAPLLRRCRFRVGAEGDDGSGIRLGLTAGAGSLHLGHGSISLPVHPPKSVSRGIFINRAGQRFVNEDVYMGTLGEHVLLRQDGEAYLLFDDENFVRPEIEYPLIAVGETPLELEGQLGMAPGALKATRSIYSNGHWVDAQIIDQLERTSFP